MNQSAAAIYNNMWCRISDQMVCSGGFIVNTTLFKYKFKFLEAGMN